MKTTNVLLSYAYATPGLVRLYTNEPPGTFRILLDSGAFTAHSTGKPIDVQAYINFLRTTDLPIWRYFALDVIGDPAGTERNYKTMLDAGLHPIPVWTLSQTLDEFEALYEHADVVGIGALVGLNGKARRRAATWRVREAMRVAAGRKVHWLGFMNLKYLHALRPYSVDSSTWVAGSRYGNLKLYHQGRFIIFTSRRVIRDGTDAFRKPTNAVDMGALAAYGIRPEELLTDEFWTLKGGLRRFTIASYIRFMHDAEENGVKVFLASITPAELALA